MILFECIQFYPKFYHKPLLSFYKNLSIVFNNKTFIHLFIHINFGLQNGSFPLNIKGPFISILLYLIYSILLNKLMLENEHI